MSTPTAASSEPRLETAASLALTSRQIGIAALIGLATLCFGLLRTAPGVIGAYHDDGIYVATGKALAEGEGYTIPFLPDIQPQTKYPPLLPAVFALIWRIAPQFPENVPLFQGFCLVSMALGNAIACLFLVRFRYASTWAATMATAFAATSPVFLLYGTMPLTEGPFSLLAILSLWAVESTLASPKGTGRRAARAGILVALSGLCRTLGFVWAGAAPLIFLLRRRGRAILPFLIFALPPMLAWQYWSASARPAGLSPLIDYYVDYASDWIDCAASDLPRVVFMNLRWLVEAPGNLVLAGPLVLLRALFLEGGGFGILVAVLAIGRAAALLREGRALPWLLGAYLLPIVMHPWPPERFWMPLAALTGGLFTAEVERLVRKYRPARMRFVLDLALCAIALNLLYLMIVHDVIRTLGYPMGMGRDTPRWESVREGTDWLRFHSSPDAVVGAVLDPMVWLYSGRRSVRYYVQRPVALFYDNTRSKLEQPEALLANLESLGADYLFEAPHYGFAIDRKIHKRILQIVEQFPASLVRVFESKDRKVRIYRIFHDKAAARPTGDAHRS